MIIRITLKREYYSEADFYSRSLKIEGREQGDFVVETISGRCVIKFSERKTEWVDSIKLDILEYVDNLIINSAIPIGFVAQGKTRILVFETKYFEIEAV